MPISMLLAPPSSRATEDPTRTTLHLASVCGEATGMTAVWVEAPGRAARTSPRDQTQSP